VNPRDLAEKQKQGTRTAPRRRAPVREQQPSQMSPAATLVVDTPWKVERRRKQVHARSADYAEHQNRVTEIAKSRTTRLHAKKRGR